jgi:Flp pilus assembly protein TadG
MNPVRLSRASHRQRQGGLAMVEFAFCLPLLLLLLFATAEFGHFMTQYSTLNDSVRDAARYVAGAALEGTDGLLLRGGAWNTLVTQGQNLAVYGNVGGSGTALLPSLSVAQITVTEDTVNNNITVAAAYPYQSFFGASMPNFMGGSIGTNFTLSISTSMRAL